MCVRARLLLLQIPDSARDIQPNVVWQASFLAIRGRHIHQDRELAAGLHMGSSERVKGRPVPRLGGQLACR